LTVCAAFRVDRLPLGKYAGHVNCSGKSPSSMSRYRIELRRQRNLPHAERSIQMWIGGRLSGIAVLGSAE
jgi:hypothetical protein